MQFESRCCKFLMSSKIIVHKCILTFERLVIIGYLLFPGLYVVQTVMVFLGHSSQLLLPLPSLHGVVLLQNVTNSPVRMWSTLLFHSYSWECISLKITSFRTQHFYIPRFCSYKHTVLVLCATAEKVLPVHKQQIIPAVNFTMWRHTEIM